MDAYIKNKKRMEFVDRKIKIWEEHLFLYSCVFYNIFFLCIFIIDGHTLRKHK